MANMWYGLAAINAANVIIQTGNLFHLPFMVFGGAIGLLFAAIYWLWAINHQRLENKRRERQQDEELQAIQQEYERNTIDQLRVLDEQFRAIQERERLEMERLRQEAEARRIAEDQRVISEAVEITKKKRRKGKIDLSKGPSIDISKKSVERRMDLN